MIKVVLYQPQIPQNTGNIVRTCSVTGCSLTLITPLGFSISDRMLKRAGLDYWNEVPINTTNDLDDLITPECLFFSSKASRIYTEAPYTENSILIFGSETTGLPRSMSDRWGDQFYTIPMKEQRRCLNLSNAVAVVIYEAWRQTGFF